jgi:hypothetical protein
VVDFYNNLFGSSMQKGAHLEIGFWEMDEKLGAAEWELLNASFTETELELAIIGMKSESAPGPMGSLLFSSKIFGDISRENS